jgi:hypothetical protein
MLMNARNQALNESLTKYELPFRRLMSLVSGAPYQSPGEAEPVRTAAPTVDMAGLLNQDYQNRLASWQQKNQSLNQALGGMFGVAGNFIKYSDRRLKTDIRKVGRTEDGQNIYSYRYKGGHGMHLGLMAQEVERKYPEAVSRDAFGFRRVDYGKALERV